MKTKQSEENFKREMKSPCLCILYKHQAFIFVFFRLLHHMKNDKVLEYSHPWYVRGRK